MKHKKAIIITLSILALLVIVVIGINIYIKSHADEIIEDEFQKFTAGKYTLSLGGVNANILGRSVTLKDIEIHETADSAGNTSSISIKKISLSGISLSRNDHKTEIGIGNFNINTPDLHLLSALDLPEPADDNKSQLKININKFELTDGNAVIAKNASDTSLVRINGVRLTCKDIAFDSSQKLHFPEQIKVFISTITMLDDEHIRRTKLDSISIDSEEKSLAIGSFGLTPQHDKAKYAHISPMHKDWTQMEYSGITMSGVDFPALLASRSLKADNLHIAGAHIESYKNRNIKRKEWIKPMFSQTLQRLPIEVNIDKVILSDLYALYEELPEGGKASGKVWFSSVSAEAAGLTNRPDSSQQKWTLAAKGKFMGASDIGVTFSIPTDTLSPVFDIRGHLGRTDMKRLNAVAVPVGKVQLDKGTIDNIVFHMRGDYSAAAIDMTLLYHDLKVGVLKDGTELHPEERRFISFVANRVVKSSNPDRKGTRASHGTFKRDPYRSPWNYMWKTIFSGAKDAVGM